MTRKNLLSLAAVLGIWGLAGAPWIRAAKARQRRIVLDRKLDDAERVARLQRLRNLSLDSEKLKDFIQRRSGSTRQRLIETGLLRPTAPAKGTAMVALADRTPQGNAALLEAKDVLYALLFGDSSSHTQLPRSHRELLTITLPRGKSGAFSFMQAATELSASGTWHDPEGVSNDEHADNMIIEVEYGEMAEELVGDGIVTALRLINNLEVNEQILYARMLDIEQSTLAD